MPRPNNPFQVVVKQVVPQLMKSKGKDGEDIMIAHVQLTEDKGVRLMSFAFRFEKPADVLDFLQSFLQKAAEIWPEDPYFKEYLDE